jgi:hypothetical protein
VNFEPARRAFASADIEQLCSELRALYPQDPEAQQLEELARFAVSGGTTPEQNVRPATRIFLENIARIAARERTGESWRRQPHRVVPREMDFIADLGGVGGWTLIQALNRIALDAIQANRCCAVVGTMRDDGKRPRTCSGERPTCASRR